MELLKGKEQASVLSASRPRGRGGGAVVLGFRSPRTTLLAPLEGSFRGALTAAVRDLAAEDATVLVESEDGDGASVSIDAALAISGAFPRTRVLTYEAVPALKFLWFFRDAEDPLFLGHASDRAVLDETYLGRDPPRLRGVKGAALRRGVEEVRKLLLTMGSVLGVRPPIPKLSPAPGGWGARRVASVLLGCSGLYAGLLHRWGSPLARVVESDDGPPRLVLADAWLAARLPGSDPES